MVSQPLFADTQVLLFDDRPSLLLAPPAAKPPSSMPPGVFTVRPSPPTVEQQLPPQPTERQQRPRRSTLQDVQSEPRGTALVSVPENDAGHFFIATSPASKRGMSLLQEGETPGGAQQVSGDVNLKSALSARRGLLLTDLSPASTATPGSKASQVSEGQWPERACDEDEEEQPLTPVRRWPADEPVLVFVDGQPIGSSSCSPGPKAGVHSPFPDGFAVSPVRCYPRTPTSSYAPSAVTSPAAPVRMIWPATPSPMASPSPRRQVVTTAPFAAFELQLQLNGRLVDIFDPQAASSHGPDAAAAGLLPPGSPAPGAGGGWLQVPSLRVA